MADLTDAARRSLEEYIADVRSSLRHCPSVEVADVERDVLEHIEHALAGSHEAVDAPELRGVLQRLGSPAQWVPPDELSWLQRALLALRSGPEDLRLGYLAFGLLAGSLFLACCLNLAIGLAGTFPFLLLGVVASFFFARASLSAVGQPDGAERWLTYPSLIAVYVPLTAILLLWPLPAAIVTELFLRDLVGPADVGAWTRSLPTGAIATFSLVTISAFWWALLSFVAWLWPAALRDIYAPFASSFRRRGRRLGFSVVCLLIFLGCVALGVRQYLREKSILDNPVATPAPKSFSESRPSP